MKLFFNAIFNDLDLNFFIKILERVFHQEIITGSFEDSDILFESVFSQETLLYKKPWKYTFFFQGESDRRLPIFMKDRIDSNTLKDYSCILKGEQNNRNIVNLPLFPLYSHTFNYTHSFVKHIRDTRRFASEIISRIPPKDICVIVSNGDSEGRNIFFDRLEQKCKIDYAGWYKNNVPRIQGQCMSPEFIEFVSQYKFIITMENSKNKDYITEKILEGFAANTIPVYWGSDNVGSYFNEERFINVKSFSESDMTEAIDKILLLLNDTTKYLEMVNQPIYKNNRIPFMIDSVASDIRNLLNIPKKQKNTFITFGGPTNNYHQAVQRICNEASQFGCFDLIKGYTDIDLIKDHTEFWNTHKSFIELSTRGYGYWIWKPYLIKKQLESMNDNDILIYCDAGCTINKDGIGRFHEYIDILNIVPDRYDVDRNSSRFNDDNSFNSLLYQKRS